ncbi:aminoglycoside phosphotransferase (APT) family kinase protein [Actinomadura pelletieri DSM 43383]|uniref:Aminoglycoside phosphotransferase (APT) family kinase protein n=1 Tax=Actinomadura pelletieri DSM 43383 TaxID=1120940 RepID=A0A495QMR4_9ACTN|nr:aminoglycoside phosphotransferase (APT) family kinase protein [Actinomadura pelletieri DSM 43383]
MQPEQIDRALVDFDVLDGWMSGQGLPGGPFEDVRPLAGRTENTMVGFRRGGRDYVLRRGPSRLRARTNDVLRREARVLAALAGTDVPAPRLVAACTDESVMGGAVFYLMTLVDGFNASVTLPEPHAGDASVRHEMGLNAARAASALGAVDHEAVGLGDFGRPAGFLERQVSRWLSELDSYNALDGYPGPDIPGVDDVARWLEERRPARWRPGILHGDFHLANLMFSPDGPAVAAIVDWETCTVGDPLLDLGWLLATWPDRADACAALAGPLGDAGGLPTADELADAYAERADAVAGRDLSALSWYGALACFKLGIVLEGTNARAFAGKAPRETGDLLHSIALDLFRRAQTFMAS